MLEGFEENYLQTYQDKVARYKVIARWKGSPVFSLYQPPINTLPGIRSLKMRLQRKFGSERIPATATISVTKACQCDCEHCSAVFYNQSREKILSTDELERAIIQSVELGATTIILLGGEPLLRKDLGEIIQSVPPDQATVILFTNGEYLTSQNCRMLKDAGLMGAFVSLDCADSNRHNFLRRRPGLFEKALGGIQSLKEAGLLAGISSYLSPQRLFEGGFEEMMELGKKTGAHEVTFFDAIPSGRWLYDETHLLKPEDRLKIARLVKEYRGREDYPGLSVQSTMTSACGSAFCFAANTQFYLTATGSMCPCDFTPLSIGRFPENSIRELWEKMIATPPYNERAKSCRMQDPDFRKRYIDPIPTGGPFPYPLQRDCESSISHCRK